MNEGLTIEERLKLLEDIEEIKRLKARYCHFADRGFEGAGHDDEGLAALFTDDGIWEGSPGPSQGHEEITATAEKFMPFGFHIAINPHIVVDGDRAHGMWWGLIPTTTAEGKAVWTAGCYQNEFVRTADGWRFKHLRFQAAFKSSYENGWAKERFMLAQATPRP